MAIINGVQLDHFPLLGEADREYSLLDLSMSSNLFTNHNTWRDVLLKMIGADKSIPYGGYLENRFFYSNQELFGKGETRRDIHLGVDLWLEADSKIYCPLDAIIHSMAYNKNDLDYGYTIILKHEIKDLSFYTLYGHLSDSHILSLKVNEPLLKGTNFCQVGNQFQNGNWPPHLHFQIIMDIENYKGDYPGVCSKKELEFYSINCPDGSSFIFES